MKKEKQVPQNHDMQQNTAYLKIKDLPENERPYEKFEKYGPESLSDAELLAVVIRCGAAKLRSTELAYRILKLHSSYSGVNCLFHLAMKDLMKINGIGRVKAIQLLCTAELARRMAREEAIGKLKFDEPASAIAYFDDLLRHLEHEEVHVAYLDMKLKLLGSECVCKGTLNHSLIEPREIFIGALRANAAFIVLAHNHPSGNPRPSDMDITATSRIRECGNIMGIKLYDHIIIGYDGCISMREKGMI
ncbi:MAG: DNA repair protein RadC [Lachnospiraceae bacterium]|nr:DNA repair protein RadC [Lachnospiraceae bacterium]